MSLKSLTLYNYILNVLSASLNQILCSSFIQICPDVTEEFDAKCVECIIKSNPNFVLHLFRFAQMSLKSLTLYNYI